MATPIKAAVVGASGYTGIELLRLILRHPGIELSVVTSRSLAGTTLSTAFPRLRHVGNADQLKFTAPDADAIQASGAQVAFLALPHGTAAEYATALLQRGLRVIDLSADFRLRSAELYAEFYGHAHPAPELLAEAVYALPEVRADAIRQAQLIACPGCYPTSILLPLIPLLRAGLLADSAIAVASMSGASGAGRKESIPLLFCEVNGSARPYSVPTHRHLSEIGQELEIAADRPVRISFVPHILPIQAGICSTIFADLAPGVTADQIGTTLERAYAASPFVRLLGRNGCPDTKNVAGTNFIDIGWSWDERASRLILLSAEDNLGKGASSQALQNFNLAFGFEETLGLLQV
ncbi:MAG: N-acetyl-gamma-glutamyl-phosphate reductase [Verrucomicrobiales bacterium]|nr:N-acetyl-gamma-glutamyl-phosphate reductase [Verrucomicrobiales bacterium]